MLMGQRQSQLILKSIRHVQPFSERGVWNVVAFIGKIRHTKYCEQNINIWRPARKADNLTAICESIV
jgi:hypothetical protein